MAIKEEYKCPICGSMDLCFGYLGTPGTTFIPTGVFTIHGFKTRSYVCLKCGYLTNYIPRDKLRKLAEKIKSQYT